MAKARCILPDTTDSVVGVETDTVIAAPGQAEAEPSNQAFEVDTETGNTKYQQCGNFRNSFGRNVEIE